MQARIVKQLIKSLTSQAKPYEVRGTQFTSFILRVQPLEGMSYIYEYTRGKQITLGKVTAFDSPDQTKKIKRKIIWLIISKVKIPLL